MKKVVYFLLALVLVGLGACDNGPKFKVQGEVTGAGDKTLYLEASALEGIVLLDSVELGSNGSFSFAENCPESPEFYRLRLDGKVINFAVDSTETVTIKTDAAKFDTGYVIEGSENNQKIKELVMLQAELQQKVDKLSQSQMPAGLMQNQLTSFINEYKEKVKRGYIFAAPNKTYAYFALFQTLNGYMIFNPLANKDDVKCFAAVATSLNNAYPHADRSRNLYNMVIKGLKNTREQKQEVLEIDPSLIKEMDIIDIQLKDLKGNVRTLTELKGKVVLIDFTVYNNAWASTHNLALRELYNKYHSKGLEIYQISLDTDEHFWKTSADNLPWVCVRDGAGPLSRYISLYGISNLPTGFLVNRKNELCARNENLEDLEAEIRKLL
ncbi:MAG: AhpC/TSA family protein [Bacteroidaceae bacterium]|nr:AhpC/TSA family protein [Bacteroidaceae bacterium]